LRCHSKKVEALENGLVEEVIELRAVLCFAADGIAPAQWRFWCDIAGQALHGLGACDRQIIDRVLLKRAPAVTVHVGEEMNVALELHLPRALGRKDDPGQRLYFSVERLRQQPLVP